MILATLIIAAQLSTSAHVVCPDRWGRPGEPLVKSAAAAKAIYSAVADDFSIKPDKEGFPAVEAVDREPYWSVCRSRPPEKLPNGEIRITNGGGQLSLHIAKCDGAISEVWLTK